MADPITVSNLTQVGRANAPDPNLERIFVTYNADFSADADITLDFTLVQQGQIFGIPRSIFMDNGSNPNPVAVWVSQTDQYFTIPAYSEGVFNLNAAYGSKIRLITDGGATDQVTVVIYNYEVPPSVWYSYGTSQLTAVSVANGADVAEGSTTDAAWNGVAAAATVISILKALWNKLTLPPIGGAWTNRSIANLIGASEQLMAPNANRRHLFIQNVAANSMGVNLAGGAAAIGTAGTITLIAGASLEIWNYPPVGAITIIGTANDDVTAYEG